MCVYVGDVNLHSRHVAVDFKEAVENGVEENIIAIPFIAN